MHGDAPSDLRCPIRPAQYTQSVGLAGLQESNEQLAHKKEAHFVTTQAQLAASQLTTALQAALEALQQELADRTQSCATATDKAATLQAELETVKGSVSSLEGQLEAALLDLAAEQEKRQAAMQSPSCILQVDFQGIPIVCLSEKKRSDTNA